MYLDLQSRRAFPAGWAGPAGLGDATQDAQFAQFGFSAGTPIVTGALAAGSAAAGGATILGMAPALAIPVVGAALAGISILATALIKNSGCGPTCVETSQWANQAEQLLRQNINAYFGANVRTASMQAAALETFDAIWGQLQTFCGQPGTGNAGVRCISDRQSGACKWKQSGSSVPPWGTPVAGACWNWFNGYRDPIANDPSVQPDTVPADVSSAGGALVGSTQQALQSVGVSSSLAVPLLIGLAVLVGVAVLT